MTNTDHAVPPPPSKADTVMLLVQEMLIDALGIVIPGFCFIVLSGAAIGPPLLTLAREMGPLEFFVDLRRLITDNALFVFAVLAMFSFVAGHILYRQDP